MQRDETELVKNGRKPSKMGNGNNMAENERSGISEHHDEVGFNKKLKFICNS